MLVQTMSPDDPVIQLSVDHDYIAFARRELQQRMEAGAPPYAALARIIMRGGRFSS